MLRIWDVYPGVKKAPDPGSRVRIRNTAGNGTFMFSKDVYDRSQSKNFYQLQIFTKMVFCTAWFTIHTWSPTLTYILADVTFFSVLRLLHKDVLNLNLAMRYSSRLDNNKPNPNNYRFQCYRNLFFVIYGRTKAKKVRKPLPSCCVLRVRELFPEANGKYTNFSLRGKRKRNWFDEQLFSCPLFITFDTFFYRVNFKMWMYRTRTT